MEVEPTSYLETVVNEATDGDVRAEQAYALAADAIRLHVASTSILNALVVLVRKENPAFADQLMREIEAMRTRIDSIAKTLDKIGK